MHEIEIYTKMPTRLGLTKRGRQERGEKETTTKLLIALFQLFILVENVSCNFLIRGEKHVYFRIRIFLPPSPGLHTFSFIMKSSSNT